MKTPSRFPWSVKLLALTAALLLGASTLAHAQEATGLELLNTDRWAYESGDTIHFTGSGYVAGSNLTLVVVHPNLSEEFMGVTADADGNLAYDYVVVNGVQAVYLGKVLNSAGDTLASVMFSDPASCDATVPSGMFPTIQSAVTALPNANPGTPCVITVLAGTYNTTVLIGTSASGKNIGGSDARRYTIQADPTAAPGSVVLNWATTPNPGQTSVVRFIKSQFITLKGFAITGAPAAGGSGIGMDGGSNSSKDVIIDSNIIYNNAGGDTGGNGSDGGINVAANNDRLWIVNNLIRNNSRNGVSITTSVPTYIVNNTIYSNGWSGVAVNAASTVHIVNNLVVKNGVNGGAAQLARYGLQCTSCGSATADNRFVQNNMFYGNARGDINNVGDWIDGSTDKDNLTPSSSWTAGGAVTGTTTGITSCVFPAACSTGQADTVFFDGSFKLVSGSPARDKGLNTYPDGSKEWVPGSDFEGNTRPQSGTVDIGWDEAPPLCTPAGTDDGNACTTDSCDPATGVVTHTPVNIDDSNACTTDACDPATGNITHTPVTPVSDNNACTTDVCDPATGNTTHTLISVDDSNACTTDACDPATGVVSHTPLAAINDGNACTTDACDPATGNITHTPVTPVSDNNACTTDVCDPATGNTTHALISVDDSNACTTDACDPATGIVSHTPLAAINDGNACTTDACDPATGNITHTPVTPVSDNNACTTDVCDPATGNTTHTPISVDDSNACTTDACDPATGNITHTPVSVDDSNACTTDSCDPSTGVHHTAVNVDDGNACTVDSCNPSTGAISHTARPDIDDGNACTTDSCDPATGVITHTGNTNPAVTSTSGPNPLALQGNSATVTANFTDVNTTQTHTCLINWDNGNTTAGTVSESGGSGACTGTNSYAATGVYAVTFTITDSCGGTDTEIQYVVIYDGGSGFVTGGGWINSPAGAYAADQSLTGKANFGFVSKYKTGMSVPTGETEFNFNVASFRFHSEVYEWMVISGAKARYRGTGSVNGSGSYGFELTAWDGNVSGGGTDKFRIKIWDTNQGNAVIYDNQMGADDGVDPTTALGGGSIVLHK